MCANTIIDGNVIHGLLSSAGVSVPGILMVDAGNGILGLEWIDGLSVRKVLPGSDEAEEEYEDDDQAEEKELATLKQYNISTGINSF